MSRNPIKLYLDSETVGLHSMPVLFQFAAACKQECRRQ
jgi:hypothetical protein